MHFIALISGGKDSIYSMLHAIRNAHSLLGCLHMASPATMEEESYMYQTAASSAVRTLVQDCLQVPLIFYQRKGKSVQTGLVYGGDISQHDEVEDLYFALQQAQQRFPNLQAVTSGAILSTYQRMRIENVCQRLGLTSISYLWRLAPQSQLLQQMLDDGIDAVMVKTACPPGLTPKLHLNQRLRHLWDSGWLEKLHQRYHFHVCGEGGEYETLVLDSPLHKRKLVLDQVEILETDEGDGVGELRIVSCHAQEKEETDVPILSIAPKQENSPPKQIKSSSAESLPANNNNNNDDNRKVQHSVEKIIAEKTLHQPTPHVHHGVGGLLYVSGLMASSIPSVSLSSSSTVSDEADLAVMEAQEIFSILQETLVSCHATPHDVVFVHLYLSEMSHFVNINSHYQRFFGSLLPPSRSCVAVGNNVLQGGRRILLDCMVQIGSGKYMRSTSGDRKNTDNRNDHDNVNHAYAAAAHATSSSKLRQVLHVQSISYWAPVCVGPYSQTNTVRSGIHFLAGQIGLIPSSMMLRDTWYGQLEQCWKNVAAVLDALNGGSLIDIVGSLIYVAASVRNEGNVITRLDSITAESVTNNSSIIPGTIDSLHHHATLPELHGGYEDAGTWEEMKKNQNTEDSLRPVCPTLVVCIPEMPKDALVEVEVISATVDAAKYLDMRDTYCCKKIGHVSSLPTFSSCTVFDTGHDFFSLPKPSHSTSVTSPVTEPDDMFIQTNVDIDAFARVLGHGCVAVAVAIAFIHDRDWEVDNLMHSMMLRLELTLADARAGLSWDKIMNIRLFYVPSVLNTEGECPDVATLHTSLQTVINARVHDNAPASTVVPVLAIDTIGYRDKTVNQPEWHASFAMQVLLLDPVHLETEIWIHKDRHYAM
jgi:diphthine-ammonia ligase